MIETLVIFTIIGASAWIHWLNAVHPKHVEIVYDSRVRQGPDRLMPAILIVLGVTWVVAQIADALQKTGVI